MIVRIEGTCQWQGCGCPATHIASGTNLGHGKGHPQPGVYCELHADMVSDEGTREYIAVCPNCECSFGIG